MKEKDEVGDNKIVAFIANKEFGNISDFIPGCEGFFYKKNGEIGYTSTKYDEWGKNLRLTEEIIPLGLYDCLYEVINIATYNNSSGNNEYYFIAVKCNQKFFLDNRGNVIRNPKSGLNFSLLKTEIQSRITFGDVLDQYPKRGGTEICGSIFTNIPGYLWNKP